MSETMKVSARAAAPIAEVRRAVTDAAVLRIWLAEHAEVDLPHRYEFWGRYTPAGDAPHQRLLDADGHTLRFLWTLDGVDTTVEIALEEETASSTVISVSQTHFDFQEALSGSSIRGVTQTFWALAVANLFDHLEGRELTPKCDFTSSDLRAELLIDASPDAVFHSLTDSEEASAWFGYPIGIEPRVGGRFAMGGLDAPNPAKILDLEPGRRVSVDWGRPGVQTWELEGSDGKTRLTLVQSGFDAEQPPYGAWTGTVAGVTQLRRFHELPDWQPIWVGMESSVS
ncbi:MAG: hypothetical protein JWN32_1201 [Solirubrobacterales bacterium]|nr:hypothetical protein [Solirubrobacterales bacterium]